MGRVETFDHTADVGLRVWGDDRNDLFRAAAEGLFDYVVANRLEIRPSTTECVELEADSPLDLMVEWLSELIFRVETRHRVYGRFDVAVAEDGRSLRAEIGGEPIDPERHELDHEVKAVTRHGIRLDWSEQGECFAEFILDI